MTPYDRDFAKAHEDFNKSFKRIGTGIGCAWVLSAILSVALVVAIIWGIIALVLHFT